MTVRCDVFSFFSHFTANVGRNTQVRRNYTTPHKTQMINTTINLLVNWMECTNLPGTTLTLRLAVKSDNSSPAILFCDSEKLDATIKLSLTLPTDGPLDLAGQEKADGAASDSAGERSARVFASSARSVREGTTHGDIGHFEEVLASCLVAKREHLGGENIQVSETKGTVLEMEIGERVRRSLWHKDLIFRRLDQKAGAEEDENRALIRGRAVEAYRQ